jgi:hypothetical protein
MGAERIEQPSQNVWESVIVGADEPERLLYRKLTIGISRFTALEASFAERTGIDAAPRAVRRIGRCGGATRASMTVRVVNCGPAQRRRQSWDRGDLALQIEDAWGEIPFVLKQ